MRSDARKRTQPCPSCDHDLSYPGAPGHECYTYDSWPGRSKPADPLAPIVALAESADRQFGSAQVITRDALWAAIAVARGEQS